MFSLRRAPHGARGLKLRLDELCLIELQSRPARGAWIETSYAPPPEYSRRSRPARGAWIETRARDSGKHSCSVAPRTGRVD